MKKFFMAAILLVTMIFTGCGGGQEKSAVEPAEKSAEKNSASEKNSAEKAAAQTSSDKKILVVYFSRTGEEYAVGKITKGNTEIIAEHIAQKVGADTFEIKPAKPYPEEYEPCTQIAKQELESNARPALAKNIDNIAQYDTIFLGYPIWWSDLPMVVYTFLESNDLSGKTIIPFCTHGGSGLAGSERGIANACPNSKLLSGLAVVGKLCQDDPDAAKKEVDTWLKGLGY